MRRATWSFLWPLLWPLLVLLATAAGCAGSREMDRETNRLAGTAWRLVAIDPPGPALTVVKDPEVYLLEFRGDGGLRVRADCNGCDGSYTSAGRTLTVLADCPTMPCTPGSLSEEFLALLNQATTFTLAGGGKDLFIATRAEQTTLSLSRLD